MLRTDRLSLLFPVRPPLPDGRRACRYCGGPVPGRKICWCSQECVDEALIRCWPSEARRQVYKRDHGVCSACGTDCGLIDRIGNKVYWSSHEWPDFGRHDWRRVLVQMGFGPPWHLWEADHIRPVVEGGGICGLANLRTLCVPCHKSETKALAGRRAKTRRRQLDLF